MRIFVAGFQHETNTFAATATDWAAFEKGDFFPSYTRGPAMLELHAASGMPISGFLSEATKAEIDIIPSCWAGASPGAHISRYAFEQISQAIFDDLSSALDAGPIDGIYLDLHGAAVTEHLNAPEAALVGRVRSLIDVNIPLVASVDLHANVDDDLATSVDFLTAYRTYPHTDMVEAGCRAFRLLAKRLAAGHASNLEFRRLPFLIPIVSQSTMSQPALSLFELLKDIDNRTDAAPSITMGFPAADVPHCGPAIWAYGATARMTVDTLYHKMLEIGAKWKPTFFDADAAVKEAIRLTQLRKGLTIIADVQDNPGAGADSNTTGLIQALLHQRVGHIWPLEVAVGLLNDPAAAKAAMTAGVGASLHLTVGTAVQTWNGTLSTPPISGVFKVLALHDGNVTLSGPMMTGAKVKAGLCACLEIEGILIAVSSEKTQMLDRVLYSMVDIEPEKMKIIVNKSAVHFRADFSDIAADILIAKSCGPMAADPADLPWQHLRAEVLPYVPIV